MIGIYKITSPSGKVYIGQSINVEQRKSYYSSLNCGKQTRLFRSLSKYGFSGHIFEVVEECDVDQLNIRERHWQDFYNVIGEEGLNCILQSTSELKMVYSEELRQRMSASMLGKPKAPFSEEHRRKMSENAKGRKMSEENKEAMRQRKLGVKKGPLSEEHKKKLSDARKKRVISEETKKKQSEAINKVW